MGPIWDRQDPGGPHVGPMNFAICGGGGGEGECGHCANWFTPHPHSIATPGKNYHYFADDLSICIIFLNENFFSLIWNFIEVCLINYNTALVSIMAWRHYLNQCWPNSRTHICDTRGRWDKDSLPFDVRLPEIIVVVLVHTKITRHKAHTIISWANSKQWLIIHTSGMMTKI